MEYHVLHPGSNSALMVNLGPGESMKAEAGTMLARSTALSVRGHLWGGAFGAFRRSVLGGETFFFQDISADQGQPGEVVIAPRVLGDIKIIPLTGGQDFFVQNGCFLAALEHVEMDTKVQKLTRGLFSGAGLFVLHMKGTGHIVVSAFGAIMEVPLAAGQQYVVDNGHIVAWSGDTEYHIVKAASGWVSSVTTGGGFACRFTGPGRIWLQTRNPRAFGAWLARFTPRAGAGLMSLIG